MSMPKKAVRRGTMMPFISEHLSQIQVQGCDSITHYLNSLRPGALRKQKARGTYTETDL